MSDTEKKIAELQQEIERLKEERDAAVEGYQQQVKYAGELMTKLVSAQQERDMYKSSSEVFYERLKKVDEERNRLFERLKVIKTLLGGVTFTDGRQWGAYNALCDIVEENEKELSK